MPVFVLEVHSVTRLFAPTTMPFVPLVETEQWATRLSVPTSNPVPLLNFAEHLLTCAPSKARMPVPVF